MPENTLYKLTPSISRALPFWISLLLVPLVALAAAYGGWYLLLVPIVAYPLITLIDTVVPHEEDGMDPATEDDQLFWYRLITLIWAPIQVGVLIGAIWAAGHGHLAGWEIAALAVVVGMITGPIGINYAHELVHQRGRLERFLGEVLLISTAYGHFRSEHVYIHHRYVGTPKDAVTARYNEGFYRFLARCVPGQLTSAFRVERERLAARGRPIWHSANPFWRYGFGALGFVTAALLFGGWPGLMLWIGQAAVAIVYLELVNYVEHYGLTRKHLGDGKYELVKPHHSWNADHKITNFLLINLQRHSDHHYRPSRRFPVLQTYHKNDAPQLPHGYPLMSLWALMPPYWRKRMNPRVDRWRARHYPGIDDWGPYNKGTTPMPR
ncbi:alkane 1-monooxygenase [Halovulum sp. GXIMD14793]